MANIFEKIIGAVWHYLQGAFKGLVGQAKVDLENWVKSFLASDLGPLAFSAVQLASTFVDKSGPEKMAIAQQDFLAKLKAAGKDVAEFSTSELNLLLETALQGLKAKTQQIGNEHVSVPAQS
jgi:hypothetical protein